MIISLLKHETAKIKNFIQEVVHKWSDKEFKKNFRMGRYVTYGLVEEFEQSIFYPKDRSHGGSLPIDAETHILSFLWFVGNKSCMRDVAQRFGIGLTTLHRQNDRCINFLLDIAPNIIKFPSTAEEKTIAAVNFAKISGFPNVLGCIDGTSVNIRTPAHKLKSTYVNRHDQPAIVLQAICDHKRRFIDVFTGAPRKIHDARVYKLSDISSKLSQVCGKTYHILGDGAYPIRMWLLTPYKDYGRFTESQKRYNQKFSATRVLIENAFGIFKGRFRQLLQLDIHSVDKITTFIVACCVLHNLCIDKQDVFIEDEIIVNDLRDNILEEQDSDLRNKMLGEEKRNFIRNNFEYNL